MHWVVARDRLPAPPDAIPAVAAALRNPRSIFPLVGEDAIRHAYHTTLNEDARWRRFSVCRVTDAAAFRMYFSRDESALNSLDLNESVRFGLMSEPNSFRYVYENAYRFPVAAETQVALVGPEAAAELQEGADTLTATLRDGTEIRASVLKSLEDYEVAEGDWLVTGDETNLDRERRTLDSDPVDRVVLHERLGDEPALAVPVTDKVVLWPLREAQRLLSPGSEIDFAVFLGPHRTACVIQWLLPNAVIVTAAAVSQFRDGTASTCLRQHYGLSRLVDSFNVTVESQAARLEEAAAEYFGICVLPALLAEHPYVQEPEVEEAADLLLSRTGTVDSE